MEREGFLGVVGSNRSWREMTYLLMSLPLGITWGTLAITLYSVSGSLLIIWAGVPLLGISQLLMRAVGVAERATINAMLGERIGPGDPVPPPDDRQPVALLRWNKQMLADMHAWRVMAWSMVRLVTGPVGFVLAIAALVAPVAAAGAFVMAILFVFGPLTITSVHDVVLDGNDFWWVLPASAVVGVTLVPVLWWVMRGFTSMHRAFARWALGPSQQRELTKATARAQLAEERLRIDQELHDSIGHMITMNIIQAGAGAHVFDTDPEFARQALKNIEERGRAAMGELDRIIAALRGDDSLPRAPLPGIGELGDLIHQSRAAGMEVTEVIEPPAVSAAIGRGAYAIVREALTNAARHAPGATVSVSVIADADALAIEVLSGPAAPGREAQTPETQGQATQTRAGGGSGIAGMRDRAALLGGRASAEVEGDGFAVRALLPAAAMLGPALPEAPSRFDHLRGTVAP